MMKNYLRMALAAAAIMFGAVDAQNATNQFQNRWGPFQARSTSPSTSNLPVPVCGLFSSGITAGFNNVTGGTTLASNANYSSSFKWGCINQSGKTLTDFQFHFWSGKQANSTNGIREVLIDSNGTSGCTFANITISGGSGSGADVRSVVTAGVISALYIFNIGSGWVPGETPTLTITSDCSVQPTAHVTYMGGYGEINYTLDQTVMAGVEYPFGTASPVRVRWNGKDYVNVPHGQIVSSDPLKIQIPPGANIRFSARSKFIPQMMAGTFTAVLSGGTSGSISGCTINTPGGGQFQTSYALRINGGSPTVNGSLVAYTYQGAAVFCDIPVAGNYGSVPTIDYGTSIAQERTCPINTINEFGTGQNNVAATDATVSGALVTNINSAQPCFTMVTARPIEGPLKGFAHIGDSIAAGFAGGDSIGDFLSDYGYPARIFGQSTWGALKLALPGYYSSSFVALHTNQINLINRAYGGITDVVWQLGTNDVLRGDSLATLQANNLAAAVILKTSSRVQRVWPITIFPRSTTTDGYQTLVNQTPVAGYGPGSVQANYNDWLKAGAPIVGGVAVLPGTSGALLSGQAGHPFAGFFDGAATVESSVNSGLWKAPSFALTGDGGHPNTTGHGMASGTTGSLTTVAGTGYTIAPSVSYTGLSIPVVTLTMSAGTIGSCAVAGNGFTFNIAPLAQIVAIGGVGSGGAITLSASGGYPGALDTCVVNTAGSNYTSGTPLASVMGAAAPIITTAVNAQGGIDFNMVFGGSGIFAPYTIVLSGGDGTGASTTPNIIRAIDPTRFNFLLKRDVDPASNDNDPMWLRKVA